MTRWPSEKRSPSERANPFFFQSASDLATSPSMKKLPGGPFWPRPWAFSASGTASLYFPFAARSCALMNRLNQSSLSASD